MSGKTLAFPVLDALSTTKTQMTQITLDFLPRIRETLQRRLPPGLTLQRSDDGGLMCSLKVGEYVTLPITIVGTITATLRDAISSNDDDDAADMEVLVHAPGLAGALPTRLSELAAFRGSVEPVHSNSRHGDDDEGSVQLGSLCLLETIRRYGIAGDVFGHYYKRARRGNCACAGSAELLARGEEVNVEGLSLDFPYHCGGAQAVKRFLDITEAACTHFSPVCGHGTKVLSRYGVAVAVGVAVDTATTQVPCLYWHPSGAPAACLAPVLHGSRLVPVGTAALAYNGPTSRCDVLQPEDPRRYMNPTVEGKYDCSVWLTDGLFGLRPGMPWPHGAGAGTGTWQVLGVAYDDKESEFDLFVQDTQTGVVAPANGV